MAQDCTSWIHRSLYSPGQVMAREHGPDQVMERSAILPRIVALPCCALFVGSLCVRSSPSACVHVVFVHQCSGSRWVGWAFAPPLGKTDRPMVVFGWVIHSLLRIAYCVLRIAYCVLR